MIYKDFDITWGTLPNSGREILEARRFGDRPHYVMKGLQDGIFKEAVEAAMRYEIDTITDKEAPHVG